MKIEYKIVSMSVEQTAVFADNFDNTSKESILNNSFSFGFDQDHHVLICLHDLVMQQNNKTFLMCQLKTFFEVSADSVSDMIENDKLLIPTSFLIQCASISYGSMRGVVLIKTKENGLVNIIIPPIYIGEIIKEPVIFELSKDNK